MALVYDLFLNADCSIEEVRGLLLEEFHLKELNEPKLRPLSGLGIDSLYVEPPAAASCEILEESLDVSPNLSLLFRLKKFDSSDTDGPQGYAALLRISTRLLESHAGDAALLFNGESVLFRRKDGVIELNDEWEWGAQDLVLLPAEFRWGTFEIV